ncbi:MULTISPECIES: hypothetical protein [Leptolyngbya]|uniref:hypothetical protein n=1 Tax=Leptolyngbya TaxID=47251 RepID=UPI0003817275|nr:MULTISPECIES: hypothetical protein [Leptolyngbya]MBD2367448.1 hypothetical protein [Leptolyngbya sp. FACHB-161]MBD2373972.1 hypothetical protein [Leptolyngbya sp. FACHB-238]MBD2398228.1 hypothetical protein [Leptolyngbya sp. FACHB-239]MBD2404275.1 hypothetical protein [Leptolyngbya sp. FACHB-402]ULP29104.1 hypothetical protein MCP04_24270 [Leptolyngbya boryana IU 594]
MESEIARSLTAHQTLNFERQDQSIAIAHPTFARHAQTFTHDTQSISCKSLEHLA